MWLESAEDDILHEFVSMDGRTDGSVIFPQLQDSFLWKTNKKGFSLFCWSFSCLQDLVAVLGQDVNFGVF